jgi:hypothetical protein
MMTVRQIEKQWNSQAFTRLMRDMLAGRPEASLRLEGELHGPLPAAALALIRLDELAQSHVPLYSRLLRSLLAAQEADGGWGDLLTTTLCLRALMGSNGQGESITRGLCYLAQMQKTGGLWPRVPIRRTDADAFVSAFILLELGVEARFRAAVRFDDAIDWFEANLQALDGETRRLWDHAAIRCRMRRVVPSAQRTLSWS